MRRLSAVVLVAVGMSFLLGGCSDQNAPVTAAHPEGWAATHPREARVSLENCTGCHGPDFRGSGRAVSCFSCHFDGPPFRSHPASWTNPIVDHRTFAESLSWTRCANSACHGSDLRSRPGSGAVAPSCFTAACHAGGPPAPHAVPYADPAFHGKDARGRQLFCRNCHGRPENTFDGGLVAAADILNKPAGRCSAADCHPSVGAHPTNWQGSDDPDPTYFATHRGADLNAIRQGCSLCHNIAGPGASPVAGAPSCFSANFTNTDGNVTGCHTEGPGTPPHVLPYAAPAAHGPVAKGDGTGNSGQRFCQTCHGAPGTTSFDGGVARSCSAQTCHPDAGAHPTNWQGNDDPTTDYVSSHRTSGDFDSCAICHNTLADAPGPREGAPSCFETGFTNSAGSSTPCHAGGPGAPHAIPYAPPASHGVAAKADLAFCQRCHGVPGTSFFGGGTESVVACSQATCHPAAGAHPTNWQGADDDTTTAGYFSSHRTAGSMGTACALCHDVTQGRTAPNDRAPSCFSPSFDNADPATGAVPCHAAGPGVPHPRVFVPLGGENLSFSLHGQEAKKDLTFCQQCHADPFNGGPGSNPRFDVPVGRLTQGCELCHNPNTAHPTPWIQDNPASHKSFGNRRAACSLCHGANLRGTAEGGVGPACTTCHVVTPPLTDPFTPCVSCHAQPPNGADDLGNRPNRSGAHLPIHQVLPKVGNVCNTCHNGAGTGSPLHFDRQAPATVSFLPAYNAKNGTARRNADGSCSSVSCHGGQDAPNWFTGSIDRTTQCTVCHQVGTGPQTPQFNSPYSGEHGLGPHVTRGCTACHDPQLLEPAAERHYGGLDTPGFEIDAQTTLRAGLNYAPTSQIPPRGICDPSDFTGCHGARVWQ